MNEIKVKVNFQNNVCNVIGPKLISGDYNSTKLIFDFDRDDGEKIFEMKDPDGKLVLFEEIKNNEIILTGKDDNGNLCSLFDKAGAYVFEISLYNEDSKLTSEFDYLEVSPEQVIISDETVKGYLPVFDKMMKDLRDCLSQVDNLDIDVEKADNKSTVTITKKDGSQSSVEILDGKQGEPGIQGEVGPQGEKGEDGVSIVSVSQNNASDEDDGINVIEVTLSNGNSYTFEVQNGSKGEKGDDGYTPVCGVDYWTESDKTKIVQDTKSELQPTLKDNVKNCNDYTDNAIIKDIKDISYNEETATFVFTRHDNTTFTVDLPIEQTVKNGYYDDENQNLVLVLVSGQEIKIPATGLIDDYVGETSATIQCVISADNKVTCNIVSGSVTKTLLSQELQDEIDGKANKSEIPKKVSQLTNDSEFITKNVDNLTNYLKTEEINKEFNNLKNDIKAKLIPSNGDLNDFHGSEKLECYYIGSDKTVLNKPSDDITSFGLIVIRIAKGYYKQILFPVSQQESKIFMRTYNGSTSKWLDWLEIQKVNVVDSLNSESIEDALSSKQGKILNDKIVSLEDKVEVMAKTKGHIYTIRRKISDNTDTTWERLDDAKGMVANATKNGEEVQNDFDNVSPWKDIISFNLDLETGKKKAYFGDVDFEFNGENGDVYTHIPTFWYKIWEENDYMYMSIADYARSGYIEIKEFDVARYHGSVTSDGKMHSYSGLTPDHSKTLPEFRTLAQDLGNNYCLLDWRYFAIQLLYLIEYADYNSQKQLGEGMTSLRSSSTDTALVEGNSVNKFVVDKTAGEGFIVGQIISIGTNGTGSFGVAEARKITAITDYNSSGVVGKEITFDGEPVDIATKNVIWSSVQIEGGCDILGMKSGCLVNDGKHSVIYRGIENLYGNEYCFIDSINIKDYQAYVCYDPSLYVSDKYEESYEKIGYININENGYIEKLGLDINNPLIQLPTKIGASSSSGITDIYEGSKGDMVARTGGATTTKKNSGLWCFSFKASSSSKSWGCGVRILKYK